MKKIIVILVLASLASTARAENIEPLASVGKSKASVEGFLGVHNSAGGGGIGLGDSLNDRLLMGIRWLAGGIDETKTYDNFDRTRIAFTSADRGVSTTVVEYENV